MMEEIDILRWVVMVHIIGSGVFAYVVTSCDSDEECPSVSEK